MTTYRIRHFGLLAVLVVAALVLAACPPPPVTPVPTTPPVAETIPPEPGIDKDRIAGDCKKLAAKGLEFQAETPRPDPAGVDAFKGEGELPSMKRPPFQGLIYVEGQVLLTGALDNMLLISDEFKLNLEFDRENMVPLGEDRAIVRAFLAGGEPVEYVTCLFNEYSLQSRTSTFADPNYFVSPAGWRGGGSPWTQNGEWARNMPGGGLGNAAPTEFAKQWAVEDSDFGDRLREWDGKTGEGVTIVVLDTSPWPDISGGQTVSIPVESMDSTMNLSLWDIEREEQPACPGPDTYGDDEASTEGRDSLSNHGLSVASLAHLVAPQSDLHLIRVLEDDGCGDLFTVLHGLELAQNNAPDLRKTVINMSLGIHVPDYVECVSDGEEVSSCAEKAGLPLEVTSLQAKIQELRTDGAVVVAAAGNDSWKSTPGEATTAEAPEIPASDSAVIGVLAMNQQRNRGCFSNSGDTDAPGGDGITLDMIRAVGTPVDMLEKKAYSGGYTNCVVPGKVTEQMATNDEYWCEVVDNSPCLVGLGLDPATENTTYLYWVGTSFATPLVSGMEALKLE